METESLLLGFVASIDLVSQTGFIICSHITLVSGTMNIAILGVKDEKKKDVDDVRRCEVKISTHPD